jgi:hypothetical protein
MAKHRRRIPAWLFGLILAAVVFALVIVIFSTLGFGDDPVVESIGSALR